MPKVGLNLAFFLFNFDSLPCRIKEKYEQYLGSQKILATHYHQQGGKNRRRGKNENEDDKRELVFREDGQEYAQVIKMLGNGRLEAMCFDGEKRLAHIRGKMRKKVRPLFIVVILLIRCSSGGLLVCFRSGLIRGTSSFCLCVISRTIRQMLSLNTLQTKPVVVSFHIYLVFYFSSVTFISESLQRAPRKRQD